MARDRQPAFWRPFRDRARPRDGRRPDRAATDRAVVAAPARRRDRSCGRLLRPRPAQGGRRLRARIPGAVGCAAPEIARAAKMPPRLAAGAVVLGTGLLSDGTTASEESTGMLDKLAPSAGEGRR